MAVEKLLRKVTIRETVFRAGKRVFLKMPTDISWIDAAVERSGLPPMADLEGGLEIYNAVACDSVSVHTFKRYAIPYKLIGRSRRYIVDDIIAFAKKRLAEAPVRTPTARKRAESNRETA
jgi:hypothetical protein